jgi:hypothetical protein
MKAGDLLLCKRNYHYHEDSSLPLFYKGEKYLVTDIFDWQNNTWVNVSFNDKSSSSFLLKIPGNHNYLWNWFYTPKEVRLMKLKQLKT